jgi:hypothetical protein
MRPITAISQVLSPILPIVYALRVSTLCFCRDEHGPDDEHFLVSYGLLAQPKLRNEPKAAQPGVPKVRVQGVCRGGRNATLFCS